MAGQAMQGKILVVDDIQSNRQIMLNMLKAYDYDVTLVENGQQALDAVKQERPDLILLDVNMPAMNGYEVCVRIKADEETSDIPVIFISAMNEIHDKVKGFQVGGVDYITKPFKMEEVLARVRSQITLSQQRQQILALSELKDQLIRTVSHDLKNPISIVMGYADMLAQPNEMSYEEIGFMATSIFQTAEKMFDLVVDLLDISQIESNMINLDLQQINVTDLFEAATHEFTLMAQRKNLTIDIDVPDPQLTICADPKRFSQVVRNLLSNAVKYTGEGGYITLAAARENGHVVLQFIDTGLGIPESAIANLFDKFYRIQSELHLEQEGTGLGLPIVKGIVEHHGGTVWVESEVGQGSVFYVGLPDKSNN